MVKVEAIVRHHRLEQVREALKEVDIVSWTVTDCRGTGHAPEMAHTFRGSQYGHTLTQRLMLTAVIQAEQLEDAIAAIQKGASTGEVGDGKIFVTEVKEVVRIRTGERGPGAIS